MGDSAGTALSKTAAVPVMKRRLTSISSDDFEQIEYFNASLSERECVEMILMMHRKLTDNIHIYLFSIFCRCQGSSHWLGSHSI